MTAADITAVVEMEGRVFQQMIAWSVEDPNPYIIKAGAAQFWDI